MNNHILLLLLVLLLPLLLQHTVNKRHAFPHLVLQPQNRKTHLVYCKHSHLATVMKLRQ
jgi:hypothetical protein